MIHRKIHLLPQNEILAKSRLTLTILAPHEVETSTHRTSICPLCNGQFLARFKFTQHLKINADCHIQYQVSKFTPIKRPNPNSNECCADEKDLMKHLLYHCRAPLFSLPLFSLPTFFAPALFDPYFFRSHFFRSRFFRSLLFSLPTFFAPYFFRSLLFSLPKSNAKTNAKREKFTKPPTN